VGRVEISVRKWNSKSSSPVPSTYQGYLQEYWGHFGESPVLDPLLAGKSANYNQASTTEPFGVATLPPGFERNGKNQAFPRKSDWLSFV